MSEIHLYKWEEGNEKIQILLFTAQIIKISDDVPLIWKLNESYIKALSEFMRISTDDIFNIKFLDGSIDLTTKEPYCVGSFTYYWFLK